MALFVGCQISYLCTWECLCSFVTDRHTRLLKWHFLLFIVPNSVTLNILMLSSFSPSCEGGGRERLPVLWLHSYPNTLVKVNTWLELLLRFSTNPTSNKRNTYSILITVLYRSRGMWSMYSKGEASVWVLHLLTLGLSPYKCLHTTVVLVFMTSV